MSQRKYNTDRFRKVHVKLSSRNTVHYKQKKPNKQRCPYCNKLISGVVRVSSNKRSNIASSKKSSSRGFGGVLCSSCSRRIYKMRARNLN